jgi:hypothetical protein
MRSILLFLLVVSGFLINGCGKNNDTILRVYVGYDGQPKLSAKVVIDGVTPNAPYVPFVITEYTDVNGLAEFNLKDLKQQNKSFCSKKSAYIAFLIA